MLSNDISTQSHKLTEISVKKSIIRLKIRKNEEIIEKGRNFFCIPK